MRIYIFRFLFILFYENLNGIQKFEKLGFCGKINATETRSSNEVDDSTVQFGRCFGAPKLTNAEARFNFTLRWEIRPFRSSKSQFHFVSLVRCFFWIWRFQAVDFSIVNWRCVSCCGSGGGDILLGKKGVFWTFMIWFWVVEFISWEAFK